jgi:hypothetical protein
MLTERRLGVVSGGKLHISNYRLYYANQNIRRYSLLQTCCPSTYHQRALLTSCYSVFFVSSLLATPSQLSLTIPFCKFIGLPHAIVLVVDGKIHGYKLAIRNAD